MIKFSGCKRKRRRGKKGGGDCYHQVTRYQRKKKKRLRESDWPSPAAITRKGWADIWSVFLSFHFLVSVGGLSIPSSTDRQTAKERRVFKGGKKKRGRQGNKFLKKKGGKKNNKVVVLACPSWLPSTISTFFKKILFVAARIKLTPRIGSVRFLCNRFNTIFFLSSWLWNVWVVISFLRKTRNAIHHPFFIWIIVGGGGQFPRKIKKLFWMVVV